MFSYTKGEVNSRFSSILMEGFSQSTAVRKYNVLLRKRVRCIMWSTDNRQRIQKSVHDYNAKTSLAFTSFISKQNDEMKSLEGENRRS